MSTSLEAGREAVELNRWQEALELFTEADESAELSADDLSLLAEAAWWNGRIDEAIDVRERAYAAYLGRGDPARAARMAIDIASDHFVRLEGSVARGWLKRAERLLSETTDSVEYGYFLRVQSVVAFEVESDLPRALELARQAGEVAARFGDRDLQALALHDEGRIRASLGEVDQGMAIMEEAMVAAVGGELGPMATGRIYCNMIGICESLADYRRAGEWNEAARRWCERAGHTSGFPGLCRVHRAEIMKLRGAWADAESEARRACGELIHFLNYTGEAFYEIGEIRLHMGDLAAAEEAFRQAHELGRDPQPGLALLRLREGRPEGACSMIARALEGTRAPLARARLLPVAVESCLQVGDLEVARSRVSELADIAGEYGSDALQAAAVTARGQVALAEEKTAEAIDLLRQAAHRWMEIDLPYHAALARTELGRAFRKAGEEDLAELELRAAKAALERLGAVPDVQRVSDLLKPTQGRRVQKTAMFTDIVGSTDLVGVIGDEAWQHLVAWHDVTLRSIFTQHGGTEVDQAGDGFFVVFDDPPAAVASAREIQRTLDHHRRTQGFSPRVRIGIHTTEAVETANKPRGRGVHQAARIASQAAGDEILVSRETVDRLDGGVMGEPRRLDLKGFAEPVEVVSVNWRAPTD